MKYLPRTFPLHTLSDLGVLHSHKHLFPKHSLNSFTAKYQGPHLTRINILPRIMGHTCTGRGGKHNSLLIKLILVPLQDNEKTHLLCYKFVEQNRFICSAVTTSSKSAASADLQISIFFMDLFCSFCISSGLQYSGD